LCVYTLDVFFDVTLGAATSRKDEECINLNKNNKKKIIIKLPLQKLRKALLDFIE
jgi:hypothetical protein